MTSKQIKYIDLLKTISSILYTALLVYIVFLARRRRHLEYRGFNLVPFKQRILEFRSINSIDLEYKFYSNFIGNILMFIPVPFIIAVLFPSFKTKSLIISAICTSVAIEIIQFIFKLGIADIDDIILNTIGAFIGIFLYRKISDNLQKPAVAIKCR